MRFIPIVATALLLAACGDRQSTNEQSANAAGPAETASPTPSATGGSRWDLQSRGEGTALALLRADGTTAVRLFCAAGSGQLLVNVPAFRPIGSEERLSFGSGGNVMALAADPRGDAQRGGVSGAEPVPQDLAALVGGRVAVSYGAQSSGPHPAPPRDLARAFVTACRGDKAPTGEANACMIQDDAVLDVAPLRAVGTEPFWGARVEGRCVTYSTPENQAGTRVWTRYAARRGGGSWSGTLDGKPFRLETRAAKDCSDGMSDNRYPIEATLTVAGEKRTGCAEPLRK